MAASKWQGAGVTAGLAAGRAGLADQRVGLIGQRLAQGFSMLQRAGLDIVAVVRIQCTQGLWSTPLSFVAREGLVDSILIYRSSCELDEIQFIPKRG